MYGILDTFDAGHWFPGIAWFLYSVVLLYESFGITYILRRRYVEPLIGSIAGLIIGITHIFVIQKCWSLPYSGVDWTSGKCANVNGAHLSLGFYIFGASLLEGVLQTPFWQRRIGALSAPGKYQRPMLIGPTIFLVFSLVVASHDQDTAWMTSAHYYAAFFAALFTVFRSVSHSHPQFTMLTAFLGMIGSLIVCQAADSGYRYWNNLVDYGYTNFLHEPIHVANLFLLVAMLTLLSVLGTMAAVYACDRVAARFPAVAQRSCTLPPALAWMPQFFDRMDEPAHASFSSVSDSNLGLLQEEEEEEVEVNPKDHHSSSSVSSSTSSSFSSKHQSVIESRQLLSRSMIDDESLEN